MERGISRATCYLNPEVLQDKLVPFEARNTAGSHISPMQNLVAVLNHAAHTIAKEKAGDSYLAIEENGLIFYAPSGTKVGDLICQFEDSDILAIVRNPASKLKDYAEPGHVVGRAINYLKCAVDKSYKIYDEVLTQDWFHINRHKVTIELTFDALRTVTRPSAADMRDASYDLG
jgi:hypothetical protein